MTRFVHLWDAINRVAFADHPSPKSGSEWSAARIKKGYSKTDAQNEEAARTFGAIAEIERAAREGILSVWGRWKNDATVMSIPSLYWETGRIDAIGHDDIEPEVIGSAHPPIFTRDAVEWYGLRFDVAEIEKALSDGTLSVHATGKSLPGRPSAKKSTNRGRVAPYKRDLKKKLSHLSTNEPETYEKPATQLAKIIRQKWKQAGSQYPLPKANKSLEEMIRKLRKEINGSG